jgi:hypothetical protein
MDEDTGTAMPLHFAGSAIGTAETTTHLDEITGVCTTELKKNVKGSTDAVSSGVKDATSGSGMAIYLDRISTNNGRMPVRGLGDSHLQARD